MPQRPYFFDLDPDSLADVLTSLAMPAYRAQQLLDWVYKKNVIDPQAMSNLSKSDRDKLATHIRFEAGTIVRHQQATDGVQKLLMTWTDDAPAPPHLPQHESHDNQTAELTETPNTTTSLPQLQLDDPTRQTECVMIPTDNRRTACISSQIGCPVGCRFCASGLGGLDGQLSRGQIVEQVWRLNQLPDIDRITNIVFMGMGEPLANFDNVINAIRTLVAPWALNISARKITVSTVGLPAQIRRLAAIDIPITLAISLHAPNDDVRRSIIPWAEFVTIEQLTDAGRFYFDQTGREVTLEYILLGGVNDQPEHATELARVAKRLRSNINLIRYNEVTSLPYQRPDDHDVLAFQTTLRRANINTHIRASRGRDIAAACGQLRHEKTAAS